MSHAVEEHMRAARLARAFLRGELSRSDVELLCLHQRDPDALVLTLVEVVRQDPSNAAMAPSLYPAYRARVEEVISRLDPEGDLSSRQLLASDTELDPNFCRCGFDPPIGPDRSNVDTSGGNDTLQLFGCASALFVALMLMWMSVFAMCGSPFAIR